jgi:Raf kinase inhibitor-like YbhB/YbcL family protein
LHRNHVGPRDLSVIIAITVEQAIPLAYGAKVGLNGNQIGTAPIGAFGCPALAHIMNTRVMDVHIRLWALCLCNVVSFSLFGCDRTEEQDRTTTSGDAAMSPDHALTLRSSAFEHGQAVPRDHTGDGRDISPRLSWSPVPAEAKELALICDDPDAPTAEPWVHWVLYKIPADTTTLAAGLATSPELDSPPGALQGKNSWGRFGYGGPAPPRGHGLHHYHFKLYALDKTLEVQSGLEKKALLEHMQGHVLAEAELVGTYQR